MVRGLIVALLLTAAVAAAAQAQSGVFTDSHTGVSFRYPPAWRLDATQPFMFPILVTERAALPRVVVSTDAIPGVSHWPATESAGAAFAYDAQPATSPEACRALALPEVKRATAKNKVTFNGVRYWHSTAGDGGMSKNLQEDIYTTFLAAPTNQCLLFDFGVYSVLAPADKPLRPLTARESARLRQIEHGILSSIRVSPPSR